MLALINKDRQAAGLSPVVLGTNTASQQHAEEMLSRGYFSHWGLDGIKPYMRYTLSGGVDYEAENGFKSTTLWVGGKDPNYKRDPRDMVQEAEQSLMQSPGHKQNILNKWHKKVNLGIAYDNESIRIVQQFAGDYITFDKIPMISNGIISMTGKVTLGAITQVAIYFDPLPLPLTNSQVEAPPYDYAYSLGQRAGEIWPMPPQGSYYSGLAPTEVVASRWDIKPGKILDWEAPRTGSFVIEANISPILRQGKGVYTLVIWSEVANKESVPMTKYSIFMR